MAAQTDTNRVIGAALCKVRPSQEQRVLRRQSFYHAQIGAFNIHRSSASLAPPARVHVTWAGPRTRRTRHEVADQCTDPFVDELAGVVEDLARSETHHLGPEPWPHPEVRSTGSHAVWDRIVPNRPGLAPITATGRLPNTFGISPGGRDIQSIAFLSTPGIELLYSGVTSNRPSARASRCLIDSTTRDAAGGFAIAVVERDIPDRRLLERGSRRG